MNKRTKRLMAYAYMPLVFMLIGYLTMYIAFKPFLDIGFSVADLVIANREFPIGDGLHSIFQPVNITESDTVPMSEIVIPEYGTHYAEISCDRINLSVPIYFGDSKEVLRHGVGQYMGSELPGFGGTILIAGHNTTFFLPLKDLEKGDLLRIVTNYGDYEYETIAIKILDHDDPEAFDLLQRERELLVAYTCYPFEAISGVKTQRLFVYAERINGPDVIEE